MSFVYYISAPRIGSQDLVLGEKLIHNFFLKLLSAPEKPSHLLFLEAGVKLLLPDSSAITALKILQDEDEVELLACKTCLQHYGIGDKVAAGRVSSMEEIIAVMQRSDKVIHL